MEIYLARKYVWYIFLTRQWQLKDSHGIIDGFPRVTFVIHDIIIYMLPSHRGSVFSSYYLNYDHVCTWLHQLCIHMVIIVGPSFGKSILYELLLKFNKIKCRLQYNLDIWVRSWNCGCLVTWFCCQLIAISWSDPYIDRKCWNYAMVTLSNQHNTWVLLLIQMYEQISMLVWLNPRIRAWMNNYILYKTMYIITYICLIFS